MQPDPSDREPTDLPDTTTMTPAELIAKNTSLAGALGVARKDAAQYRIRARDQVGQIAKGTGLELPPGEGDKPPDPEVVIAMIAEREKKRSAALEEATKQVRTLKVRATLAESIQQMGLRPSLTKAALISEGVMDRIHAAVDAPDFEDQVSDALGELVEKMPEVRDRSTVASKSSAHFRPGQQLPAQLSRGDLQGMTDAEINLARESGLLDALLGRER